MKFGKVNNPENIDFTLPKTTDETLKLLQKNKRNENFEIYIGCAKWSRKDLKNFYPRGTKDELPYYATQFNSIELNAFFYKIFSPYQVKKWKEKTGDHFKFYPKVPRFISQYKRLKNVESDLNEYIDAIVHFEEKLGMCFLQMPPNFSPKSFHDLEAFVNIWPKDINLSVELRHEDWYSDKMVFAELCSLLESHQVTHTITDTAGRRDLIHMRLTTPKCFVRFTGANHSSDYDRLDDWANRLKAWKECGIKQVNFFLHQNISKNSHLLAAYLNKKLNKILHTNLIIPKTLNNETQPKLF